MVDVCHHLLQFHALSSKNLTKFGIFHLVILKMSLPLSKAIKYGSLCSPQLENESGIIGISILLLAKYSLFCIDSIDIFSSLLKTRSLSGHTIEKRGVQIEELFYSYAVRMILTFSVANTIEFEATPVIVISHMKHLHAVAEHTR